MQCFQLAKREHCKARIAKGELTWRMEKPKKPASRISARRAAGLPRETRQKGA
jgi:hypothetical protein